MKNVITRKFSEVTREPVGELFRQVLFSPAEVGNARLRVALMEAPAGAAARPHTHPGEEIIITLEGSATLHVEGGPLALLPETATMIPPGIEHFAVASDAGWKFIAIFCDECPFLAT